MTDLRWIEAAAYIAKNCHIKNLKHNKFIIFKIKFTDNKSIKNILIINQNNKLIYL